MSNKSANMIVNNAEIEKKSDEISAQDVEVISGPKVVTVESILFMKTNLCGVGFVKNDHNLNRRILSLICV